jgi:hypothetical protein
MRYAWPVSPATGREGQAKYGTAGSRNTGVVPDLLDERKLVHAVVLKAVLVINEVASGPYYLRRDE